MDAGALADKIAEDIGIKIGLRWKVIKTGAKKISNETKTRALIIEVSNEHKWTCQRKLMKLYGRTNKDCSEYPNGIRLRFVKLKKDALNAEEKGKLDKLRNRQHNFLNSIKSSTSYEILQLDYLADTGNIPTLRQMIMSLNSSSRENTPIFHCVDMDWQEDGFVFQYSSQLADKAETTLNTLLPLLKHYFPTADAGSNFTNKAEDRCRSMFWDESKQMIVDSEACETENIGDNENLVGFTFEAEVLQSTATRPNIAQNYMADDGDSVSTFCSIKSRFTSNYATSVIGTKSQTSGPITTSSTHHTPSTLTSLPVHNTNKLSDLTSQVQAQLQQVNNLQTMLQQLLQTHQSSLDVSSSTTGGAQARSGDKP